MDQLEEALRKFKAARNKMFETYPKEYSTVELKVTRFEGERFKTECCLYAEHFRHTIEASTWEDAFIEAKLIHRREAEIDS